MVSDVRADVIDGQQMHFAMKMSCMFPTMAIQMTSIGEESGELEKMLEKVATYYEAEVDSAVDGLTSMLEPLVMCILGIVVGGLVIAMYLPIFQMGAVV
ncbi:Type II secretion system protein F [compost metagenome]